MKDPDTILRKVLVLDGRQRRLMEAGWRFQLIGPLLDGGHTEEQKAKYREGVLERTHEHPWRGSITGSCLRKWCNPKSLGTSPGVGLFDSR